MFLLPAVVGVNDPASAQLLDAIPDRRQVGRAVQISPVRFLNHQGRFVIRDGDHDRSFGFDGDAGGFQFRDNRRQIVLVRRFAAHVAGHEFDAELPVDFVAGFQRRFTGLGQASSSWRFLGFFGSWMKVVNRRGRLASEFPSINSSFAVGRSVAAETNWYSVSSDESRR